MRISISARIFGGFLVLLAAFGGVMGYTLLRIHQVRQDLRLTNNSYLRLVLVMSDLHISQGHLLNTVDERGTGQPTPKLVRTQVKLALVYRQRKVALSRRLVVQGRQQATSNAHRRFLDRIDRSLHALQRAYQDNEPLFSKLFQGTGPPSPEVLEEVGQRLLGRERRIAGRIKRVFDDLRGQVKAAALQVEAEENRAIWAILVMVVLATLISIAVTFGARITLRPLKTLVAGTKRIGSGDYAHRVDVRSRDELGVLASEFNNMAADIQERESRLIRSERMATAGRMASHVTHEIRNPLSSISLNTELLEEEVEGLSGSKEAIEEALSLCQAIRKEVDRLTDFTEQYLRFARLPQPRLADEDIATVLYDLLSFTSGEMSAHNVTVRRDLASDLPPVQADESQLRRAFLNLFRNAGEAMSPEGGTLSVSAHEARGNVEVCIADTGPGIPDDDLRRVFEPFFSTKETGTGLGLALTHQIIQEHGGTIEVDSGEGQGTRFTVKLPLSHATEEIV